jgi:hypothetical protein
MGWDIKGVGFECCFIDGYPWAWFGGFKEGWCLDQTYACFIALLYPISRVAGVQIAQRKVRSKHDFQFSSSFPVHPLLSYIDLSLRYLQVSPSFLTPRISSVHSTALRLLTI